MHRQVCQDNEASGEDGKANDIAPQSKDVEAKGAEDRRARDFDVEAVLVIDQGQILDFVDDQGFKAVVEDG